MIVINASALIRILTPIAEALFFIGASPFHRIHLPTRLSYSDREFRETLESTETDLCFSSGRGTYSVARNMDAIFSIKDLPGRRNITLPGMTTVISVPEFAELATFSFAPMRSARSCIPCKP
jgi:hypothetical protein